jgi:hypothetical protein
MRFPLRLSFVLWAFVRYRGLIHSGPLAVESDALLFHGQFPTRNSGRRKAMRKALVIVAPVCTALGPGCADAGSARVASATAQISPAIASSDRPAADSSRDVLRNPADPRTAAVRKAG